MSPEEKLEMLQRAVMPVVDAACDCPSAYQVQQLRGVAAMLGWQSRGIGPTGKLHAMHDSLVTP